MITIKFFGGVKKSFNCNSLSLNKKQITVNELLDYLVSIKPSKTLEFDQNNILIAINGIDSSALKGRESIVSSGDVVSIIPIIHGGYRNLIKISDNYFELFEIKGDSKFDRFFIEDLRKQHPNLKLQAISSKFILSKSHAQKVLNISLHVQKNKTLLSTKLEIDWLLRFALTNQISQAISKAGIKPGENFIIIATGSKKKLDDFYNCIKLLCTKPFSKNYQAFLKKEFGITRNSIKSIDSESPLEDILTEKAAILF